VTLRGIGYEVIGTDTVEVTMYVDSDSTYATVVH
jgi:hypothetical protein